MQYSILYKESKNKLISWAANKFHCYYSIVLLHNKLKESRKQINNPSTLLRCTKPHLPISVISQSKYQYAYYMHISITILTEYRDIVIYRFVSHITRNIFQDLSIYFNKCNRNITFSHPSLKHLGMYRYYT